MAPEQFEGKEADPRSDIFAFGCLLYEMVTGRAAFSGANSMEVVAAVVDRVPLRPRRSMRKCRPPLIALCNNAWRTIRKSKRWQSARDLKKRAAMDPASHDSGGASNVLCSPGFTVDAGGPERCVGHWPGDLDLGGGECPRQRRRNRWSAFPSRCRAANRWMNRLAIRWRSRRMASAWPMWPAAAASDPSTSARWILWKAHACPARGGPAVRSSRLTANGIGFEAAGKLVKVPVSGGSPQVLCDVLFPAGATWGRDDTIVLTPLFTGGLFAISARGGKPRRLTTPDSSQGEAAHLWPDFLPDGKHVLFTIWNGSTNWDQSRIAVLLARIPASGGRCLRAAPLPATTLADTCFTCVAILCSRCRST